MDCSSFGFEVHLEFQRPVLRHGSFFQISILVFTTEPHIKFGSLRNKKENLWYALEEKETLI